jgi:hypothetical protein
MSHTATGDALAHCTRIRDLILYHRGGWADREALLEFRRLARAAAHAADDDQCAALMRSAEQYAADLFSDTAHYKWTRAHTSGAHILRLCILEKIFAFRDRVMELGRA